MTIVQSQVQLGNNIHRRGFVQHGGIYTYYLERTSYFRTSNKFKRIKNTLSVNSIVYWFFAKRTSLSLCKLLCRVDWMRLQNKHFWFWAINTTLNSIDRRGQMKEGNYFQQCKNVNWPFFDAAGAAWKLDRSIHDKNCKWCVVCMQVFNMKGEAVPNSCYTLPTHTTDLLPTTHNLQPWQP